MTNELSTAPRSARELRRYGLTMAVAFGIVAAIMAWRGRDLAFIVAGVGGLFALIAITYPRALGPVERVWLVFGARLSVVMTFVILTLTFLMIITPLGLIMRLVGRRPLQLRFDPHRVTYWDTRAPQDPKTGLKWPF